MPPHGELMRTILMGVAKNMALFYGIYFGVTFASVFLLVGGLEGIAGSGLVPRLPQIVTFLALPSIASSIASLLIRKPHTRGARVLVSAIAAGSAYAALAAVGVSVAAPGMEDLFASPFYLTLGRWLDQ
jgi:hypothetical protein